MSADPTLPISKDAEAIDPARILVVIPTLNEADHIDACVRSLMTGDSRLASVAVLVADGGSTDETCAIVKRLRAEFPNLDLVHNPGKLQSAAVNLAAGRAPDGVDILVRCDAHSIYPQRFVLTVAETLARTGAQSVVVPMDAVGETCFQRGNAWVVDSPLGSGGAAHRGGRVSGEVDHGHHAAFDLPTFRALGGYDASFSHNEDAEFDHRLIESGGRIFMDAEARIKYLPRSNFSAVWRQYRNYGRGRAMTLAKHGATPKLRQLIPVLNLALICASMAGWAVAGLAGAFDGRFGGLLALLLSWPAIYAGVLLASGLALAIKHRSACGFAAAPVLLAIHNAWAIGFVRQFFLKPHSEIREAAA